MILLVVDDEINVRESIAYAASLSGWKTFTQDQHADSYRTILENDIDMLVVRTLQYAQRHVAQPIVVSGGALYFEKK